MTLTSPADTLPATPTFVLPSQQRSEAPMTLTALDGTPLFSPTTIVEPRPLFLDETSGAADAPAPDVSATEVVVRDAEEEPLVAAAIVAAPENEPAPVAAPLVAEEPTTKFRVFTLVDPNRFWVMIVAIVLLGGVLAANLGASFTSVYASAAWIGLPEQVQWLPVVILDVAILGFSWALMVFSTRAADESKKKIVDVNALQSAKERTWSTRAALAGVTAYSVASNFLHTYTFWHENLSTPQAIYGVLFSCSIPIMSFIGTEELIRLVFVRRRRVHTDEA